MPQVTGIEVPDEVLNAPRPLSPPPPSANAAWPRLGDVPSHPKDFPPQAEINREMQQMEWYRTDSGAAPQQTESGNR